MFSAQAENPRVQAGEAIVKAFKKEGDEITGTRRANVEPSPLPVRSIEPVVPPRAVVDKADGLLQRRQGAFFTESGPQPFSSEKSALVDMAQADKRTGMSSSDMQAYKELNRELPNPFPRDKVRGPERHLDRNYKEWHGHVGPINHIPIKDK
ncbi:hypothetical protein [Hyphomonas atlantica]|uniref:Uncharacterized protein n=1 Tax=Hyphomonas atlantica TaxID=1280948 RepID=A0A059E515_9PROT|nr:hypothetical protein [Hyphomonas atlantica]KCZ63019.1 hypothetical protein HY36_14905 [Hyphomonas atlantica]